MTPRPEVSNPSAAAPSRNRPRPVRVRGRIGMRAILVLLLCAACGCVTEGPPPSHPPVRPVQEPKGVPADVAVLSAAPFADDTDGDGYFDTVLVTVHLFSRDPRYEVPVAPPGSFKFSMIDREGKPIAEWTFDAQKTTRAKEVSPIGVGFVFNLSLLDAGGDQVQVRQARLSCTFLPEKGKPVHSRGSVTVTIGPVM